jgi:hypothetical protein
MFCGTVSSGMMWDSMYSPQRLDSPGQYAHAPGLVILDVGFDPRLHCRCNHIADKERHDR